jgi:hypothetical protein
MCVGTPLPAGTVALNWPGSGKGIRSLFRWSRGAWVQFTRSTADAFATAMSEHLDHHQSALAGIAADEFLSTPPPADLPPCLDELIENWIQAAKQPSD